MTSKTLLMARRLAAMSGDDQSLDDIVAALWGYGPLMHHTGNQLAHMLLRHLLAVDRYEGQTSGSVPVTLPNGLVFQSGDCPCPPQRPQTGQGDVAGPGDAQRHGGGTSHGAQGHL